MGMTITNPLAAAPPLDPPYLAELPDLSDILAQAYAVREAAIRDRDEAQAKIDKADAYIAALTGQQAPTAKGISPKTGKPWSHSISETAVVRVLTALSQRQHKTETEALARQIGLSRTTVGRAYRVLEDRGHADVSIVNRKTSARVNDAGRLWLAERQREAQA